MPNHGVHDTSLLVVPFKSWCYRLFCWSLMVSGCFEPSQPHRVISGLRSLMVSWLVGVLSPVSHTGLYQGLEVWQKVTVFHRWWGWKGAGAHDQTGAQGDRGSADVSLPALLQGLLHHTLHHHHPPPVCLPHHPGLLQLLAGQMVQRVRLILPEPPQDVGAQQRPVLRRGRKWEWQHGGGVQHHSTTFFSGVVSFLFCSKCHSGLN